MIHAITCHPFVASKLNAFCRYLVPADLTVGQFVYVIRKRIKVSPEKAIFMFVKNVLPPTGVHLSTRHNIASQQLDVVCTTVCVVLLHKSVPEGFLTYWHASCGAAALMSDVYEDHKDEDGFLYITYSGENTFGC